MKTYEYIITFKSRNQKIVDRISLIMLIMAVVVFIFSIFTASAIKTILFLSIIVLLMVGYTAYLKMRENKGQAVHYRVALLLAACGWYLLPHGLIPFIAYLLAALLEKQAKFPHEVAFDKDEIVINSFPRKHYQWSDMNNVVLKDNLLTIDFKNNKLVQKETESPVTDTMEAEFNEFCKQHLN